MHCVEKPDGLIISLIYYCFDVNFTSEGSFTGGNELCFNVLKCDLNEDFRHFVIRMFILHTVINDILPFSIFIQYFKLQRYVAVPT